MKLSISKGNSKLGRTANISLPPHVTCIEDVPCRKDCYAYHHAYRLYPQTHAAWDRNLALWQQDPDEFEWQLRQYLLDKKPAYFRWHVGGDIPDEQYAYMLIRLANTFTNVKFLIYTRRRWLDKDRASNLAVMHSQWINEDVPTKRRKFIVLEKGAMVPDDGLLCPGECDLCRACWNTQISTPIYIHKH